MREGGGEERGVDQNGEREDNLIIWDTRSEKEGDGWVVGNE
jgi:hypothetical protein